MEQANNLQTGQKKSIFRIFKKKKFIFGLIILLGLGYLIFGRKANPGANILTEKVRYENLKQTVLATGQVTSKTDLSLSFKTSGIVSRLNVKVGDKVKEGQILASLESRDTSARLTQALGTLAQAKANYQKVLDGASSEEVQVAEVALKNAENTLAATKTQQDVLVKNAYAAMLNSSPTAAASLANTSGITITVSGFYNSEEKGEYTIRLNNTGAGLNFQANGLENASGKVSTTPQPLGTRGLFIEFSSTSVNNINDTWTISIPNTQASVYVANYNAYLSALETRKTQISAAENAVASAQANLDLKKAAARPADLEAARASVLSAEGQVLAARADLANASIVAPANGTITKTDIKPGELATALKEAVVLQDVDNLHIEANISEANIVSVKLQQPVEITFDSLGPDRKFAAQVSEIEPASNLVSGVVNYKVTISLEKFEEVRPGMTANVNILTAQKDRALAIPQRAVSNQDGKKSVKVVTNSETKDYQETEVVLGTEADGGLVEVLSGLSEGQEIVTFVKSN